MSLKVTNCAGSIGDCLSMTPLFKKGKGTVIMLKNDKTEKVLSKVYDGVADIEFVDYPQPPCPETNEDLCYSQRILNRHGIKDVSPIPFARVTEEEIVWARDFLKEYKNPIAFNSNVGEPENKHPLATYRQLPLDLCNYLIKEHSKNTILEFGLSKNNRNLEGTIKLFDLSIRQLAACYYVIGKYVGADTGDYHLMMAVGGKCDVYIPPSVWHYNHLRHLYLDYAWKLETEIRVNYFVFSK